MRWERVGLDANVGQVVPHLAGGAQLAVEAALVPLRNLRVGLAVPVVGRRCRLAERRRVRRGLARRRLARGRRRKRIVVGRATFVALTFGLRFLGRESLLLRQTDLLVDWPRLAFSFAVLQRLFARLLGLRILG